VAKITQNNVTKLLLATFTPTLTCLSKLRLKFETMTVNQKVNILHGKITFHFIPQETTARDVAKFQRRII